MDLAPAVSPEINQQIRDIGSAEVMVAIPAYNNERTISQVMEVAAEGLTTFFADTKSVIFVCEGGSLDETKNVARMTDIGVSVDKMVGTYRGESGKGNAMRAVFQAALTLGVKGCALIDGDTRSMSPDWVNNLLTPIVRENYDFVAPYYKRYKFDGTITNIIVYPMISALYGKRLRQPIGGEYGLSKSFLNLLAKEDVWDVFVGQFGIDAWMSITAITKGIRICQANLGAKVHAAKDPAFKLGPMYLHVISTLFRSMTKYQDHWMKVNTFEDVKLEGTTLPWEPEPMPISVTRLVDEFNMGMAHFSSLYKEILSEENYSRLAQIARSEVCMPEGYCDFFIPSDLWARIVYDLAVVFNCWKGNTHKLIDLSSPLYFGKVASFTNRTIDLNYDETEKVIEDNRRSFENEKVYLVNRWKEMKAGDVCTI